MRVKFSFLFQMVVLVALCTPAFAGENQYTLSPTPREEIQKYVQESPDFDRKIAEIKALNAELKLLNQQMTILNHGIRRAEQTQDPELRRAVMDYLQSNSIANTAATPHAVTNDQDLKDIIKISRRLLKNGNTQKALKDLGATPTADDMTAILIFAALQKMSKGEDISLDSIEDLFEDNLPEEWQPVVKSIKRKYPRPRPDLLPEPPAIQNIPAN